MERRFVVRLNELLEDAHVPPVLLQELLPRLESFLQPFIGALANVEQRLHGRQYICGLLSDLKSKDVESIAYLHDQERQGLQKFIGQVEWDYKPLQQELVRQVAAELGEADAVLVFDPSGFAKKGTESVGVKRQWCGRLGKIENCQVGIYLGYVSRRDHALVDVRLYLPKEWAEKKRRRKKVGVPPEIRFRTRHELMLEMLDEQGALLPHAWIAGDDELGRSSWFRQELHEREETYLLAVPCNTLVCDLKSIGADASGEEGGPDRPIPFVRVDRWCAALPESAWRTIEVRDGEKGPLTVQGIHRLVQARTQGRPSNHLEYLVVFREQQPDGVWKLDYLLSNAPLQTPLTEFARVFKAEHRIEECLKRAKSEAGLADYQVRTWEGWHHHQTLSLIAAWFLTQETGRGKNLHTCPDSSASPHTDRWYPEQSAGLPRSGTRAPQHQSSAAEKRRGQVLSLEKTQTLATATL